MRNGPETSGKRESDGDNTFRDCSAALFGFSGGLAENHGRGSFGTDVLFRFTDPLSNLINRERDARKLTKRNYLANRCFLADFLCSLQGNRKAANN